MTTIAVRLAGVVVCAALGAPGAHADPTDALVGRFAFDWLHDPAKARCAIVKGALLQTLKSPSYACEFPETVATSTGKPAVKCGRNDGKVEYLVFRSQAACEGERVMQAANGD